LGTTQHPPDVLDLELQSEHCRRPERDDPVRANAERKRPARSTLDHEAARGPSRRQGARAGPEGNPYRTTKPGCTGRLQRPMSTSRHDEAPETGADPQRCTAR
jgi:hypothetical protein